MQPTYIPTADTSAAPSFIPSVQPSSATPTTSAVPTRVPSIVPTFIRTSLPTKAPSLVPTRAPTLVVPTRAPTLVSSAPSTLSPTQTPSIDPTAAPEAVSIAVIQVIPGMSYETYSSNSNYTVTLTTSIAACMTDVSLSDIVNLVVTDGSTSTTASAADTLRRKRDIAITDASTTDSIIASYDVYVATPSSEVTYETLVSQLRAAVSGTTFITLLATYSAVYSTPGFSNVTASTLLSTSDSSYTPSTTSSTNGNDEITLSVGAISGIAIGGFVLLACCFTSIAYQLGWLNKYELESVSPAVSNNEEHYSAGTTANDVNMHSANRSELSSGRRGLYMTPPYHPLVSHRVAK